MKMNQREDPAGRTLSFGEWAGDGSVSCRQVDRNGFVIVWTARWKVLEISKDNESTLGNPVCPRFPGFSISPTSLNSSPNISRLLEILNNGVRGLAPSVSGW